MEPIVLFDQSEERVKTPVDGYRQLAVAVVLQALYDLQQRQDPADKLDAMLFVTSGECASLCQILGLPDPVRALFHGGQLQRRRRVKQAGWRISPKGKRSEQP